MGGLESTDKRKREIYSTVMRPTMLHSIKTVALKKTDVYRIEIAEMKLAVRCYPK